MRKQLLARIEASKNDRKDQNVLRKVRRAFRVEPWVRATMTELFYWKEMERRARAARALALLYNRTDSNGINQANAILDELCLDRKGAERLIKSRIPQRLSWAVSQSPRAMRPPSVG